VLSPPPTGRGSSISTRMGGAYEFKVFMLK
jgi:hypothetical protein